MEVPAIRTARPRLVFVDHSYHVETGSSRFFRTVLSEVFDIVQLHCEDWRGGRRVSAREVDAMGADVVVFWQALPSPIDLFNLTTPAVWAPMYDSVARHPRMFWRVLSQSDIFIVSFCHALSRIAARHGMRFAEYTYYPQPSDLPRLCVDGDGLQVFLWDRGEVGIDQLRRLVRPQDVKRTVLRLATDPGLRPTRPCSDDVERYGIQLVAGHLPRDEHLRLLASCNVFLAPRRLEGIGLSVLEAMAMGLAVIAPDRPTMNEYIEPGVTGYLYDPRRPHIIDLRRAAEVGASARASMSAGRQEWMRSRRRALADVLAATPVAASPPLRIAAEARALALVELMRASIPGRPRSLIRRTLRARRR
jgi:Glycosyl transferases group 1